MIPRFSTTALLCTLLLGLSPGVVMAAPATAWPHLRYTDALIAQAVARGGDSPAFDALRERIEHSDVIVILDRQPCGGRSQGATQFLSDAGGFRYVRVTLRIDQAGDAETALLAHELQHVIELIDANDVRSEDSYLRLYRRIGRPGCGAPAWCFDTDAARRTGTTVLGELRSVTPRGRMRSSW